MAAGGAGDAGTLHGGILHAVVRIRWRRWCDIALYVLVMAAGFWIAYWRTATGHGAWCAGVLVIAVGLLRAALILFTLAPPELPVFVG